VISHSLCGVLIATGQSRINDVTHELYGTLTCPGNSTSFVRSERESGIHENFTGIPLLQYAFLVYFESKASHNIRFRRCYTRCSSLHWQAMKSACSKHNIVCSRMSPRKRWRASCNRERAKLAASLEGNWNLSGISQSSRSPNITRTRTRKGGHGRPNLVKKEVNEMSSCSSGAGSAPSLSSSDSNWSYHESDDTDCNNGSDEEEEDDPKKPPTTRVIVKVEGLKSTLEMNSFCMQCDRRVSAILRTTCLATTRIMLKCKDRTCGFIYYSTPPSEIDIKDDMADHRERSSDYAVNILYVLGFISCGHGGTEAARILGLLGLPNDTTMQSRSFNIIEDHVSNKVQELTTDLLKENLIEEVRRFSGCINDFQLWRQSIEPNASIELCKSKYPNVTCSFDMCWQQRSSGKVYS
jgi:hypothetical protein